MERLDASTSKQKHLGRRRRRRKNKNFRSFVLDMRFSQL
jgi:hypothetical protein